MAQREEFLPDHAIIALIAGCFAAGFLAYLFLSPYLSSTDIAVSGPVFSREEGTVSLTIANEEQEPQACSVTVVLSSGGVERSHRSVDAGIIAQQENRTVLLEADLPEGKIDYDLQVYCVPASSLARSDASRKP